MKGVFISLIIVCIIVMFMSYKNQLKKYELLDKNHSKLLKGIAATLVIFSHLGSSFNVSYLVPLGGIGVTIFLIITGFGLNESYNKNGLKNFLVKRLSGILIPYWLVVIFYWIVNYKLFNLIDFINSFILIHRLSLTWFVYYILIWYLIFYLVKRYFKNDNWFILISILMFLFISERHIAEQSFSIVLGILYSQNDNLKTLINANKFKLLIISLLIGGIFSGLFFYAKIAGFDNRLILVSIQILMKTGISLAIMQFTSMFKFKFYSGLSEIGLYSLEIYLVHSQILSLLNNNFKSILIFFITTFVTSILIRNMSNFLVKKISYK